VLPKGWGSSRRDVGLVLGRSRISSPPIRCSRSPPRSRRPARHGASNGYRFETTPVRFALCPDPPSAARSSARSGARGSPPWTSCGASWTAAAEDLGLPRYRRSLGHVEARASSASPLPPPGEKVDPAPARTRAISISPRFSLNAHSPAHRNISSMRPSLSEHGETPIMVATDADIETFTSARPSFLRPNSMTVRDRGQRLCLGPAPSIFSLVAERSGPPDSSPAEKLPRLLEKTTPVPSRTSLANSFLAL